MPCREFQHVLSPNPPAWLEGEKANKWVRSMPTIIKRLETLQAAWDVTASADPGASFLRFRSGAELMFEPQRNQPLGALGLLDQLSPDEVSDMAMLLSVQMPTEPERVEFPNCDVVVDTAFVTTAEWELLRCIGVGGSDAAAVMGLSPFRGAQDVYADKRGLPTLEVKDRGRDYIFEYGHRVEDVVINQFCRITGAVRLPETRMFRHRFFPEITANIDGVLRMPDGTLTLFEAKTANPAKREHWLEGPPDYYITQCMQYMGVLDDNRIKGMYIGCVFDNNPDNAVFWYVPRNTSAEADQLEAEDTFWSRFILAGHEPPISGYAEIDHGYHSRKFSKLDTTVAASLGSSYRPICAEWLSLQEQKAELRRQTKAVEERMSALAAELEDGLGDKAAGLCGEYTVRVTEKKPRTSIDAQRLRLKFPEAFRDCKMVTGLPTRTVTVKA